MRTSTLSVAIALLVLVASCSNRQRIPNAFVGVWQSDEAMTLKSLKQSKTISDKELEVFTDKFFGDRVIVYKPLEYTAYWVGDEWENVDQEEYWLAYDFVDSGADFVTIRYPANDYVEAEEKTWRVEGEMIYVELPQWGFREYFRRIND